VQRARFALPQSDRGGDRGARRRRPLERGERAARSLEAYSALMNEAAELLTRKLADAAAAGAPVDVHRLLGDMTMQVVGTTAFGRARRASCGITGLMAWSPSCWPGMVC